MKKRIVSIFSVAVIFACVLSTALSSDALAKPPEPTHFEWSWEGTYECEGFQIDEEYHEVGEGLTHFDNDGHPLRSWILIKGESVLTRVGGDPDVKLFTTANYNATSYYDEAGYNYATAASGISWKITAPGHGVLLIGSGHVALNWDTGELLHLTPNWYYSPDDFEAVCAWFESH